MKKNILPIIAGAVIAFGVFWLGHPSSQVHESSGVLSKKEFAKNQIDFPQGSSLESEPTKLTVHNEKVKSVTTEKKINQDEPTKGDFIKIADTFITEIVQPTNDNYQVKNYKSKEQLVKHLSQYASKETADYYVDGLYEEKGGNLYIVPTELPPWLDKGQPSDLSKLDDKNYMLHQKNSSDLYGHYEIQLSYTKENDHWVIKTVKTI